jgi:H+/Cl- antiporter ClcA
VGSTSTERLSDTVINSLGITLIYLAFLGIGIIYAVIILIGDLISPHALGIGYDTIHALMYSNVVGLTLISLLIVKMLICSIAWDRVRRGASWLPC